MAVDGSSRRGLAEALAERWDFAVEDALQALAEVYTDAMRALMEHYKEVLRADVVAGGFYNALKLSKTWRATTYPARGKPSINPAGWIATKAVDIIEAFTLGVTITAPAGHFLAIPVGPAKEIVRRFQRDVARSPIDGGLGRSAAGKYAELGSHVQQVAAALGVEKLDLRLNPQTGRGVLVAGGRSLTKGGKDRSSGPETVLFILVRQATLKKRMQGLALLADLQRSFPEDFEKLVQSMLPAELRG